MLTISVLMALATFRITRLVTQDVITERIREWILIRFPNDDEQYTWQIKHDVGFQMKQMHEDPRSPTFFGRLISCDYCVSVWIAPVVYLLSLYAPVVVIVLGIAGAAYLLSHYASGDNHG